MQQIFTEVVTNAILTLLIPAIGSGIVVGIKHGIPFLILKIKQSKLAFTLKWVDKMVQSAEQKWTESGSGELKKEFVTELVSSRLKAFKIKLSDKEIDALIEASVKELTNAAKVAIEVTDKEI